MRIYSLLGIESRGEFVFSPGQTCRSMSLESGIRFYFATLRSRPVSERQARDDLLNKLSKHPVPWLQPGRKYWSVDLNGLASILPQEKRNTIPSWLAGIVAIEPIFESGDVTDIGSPRETWRGYTCFDVTKNTIRNPMSSIEIPPEIQQSLEDFSEVYPASSPTAFIMMRFGQTAAHLRIMESIKKSLEPMGVIALRADDREFHSDLFANILTYMYGCRFGVAVFERIEGDDFNPNVSLEVGYMLAMGKPVCFLKDRTLRSLQTDLLGKLYRPFDPYSPETTIPAELARWCKDRGMA